MKKISGFILLFIATILKVLTNPIAMAWTLFLTKDYDKYLHDLAVAEDRYGNVLYRYIFNRFLINPNGYKYGNGKETISSATGKNQYWLSLTPIGIWFNHRLDFFFGKNHSIDSIDNKV